MDQQRPSEHIDIFGQFITSYVTLMFWLFAFVVCAISFWGLFGWMGTLGLIACLLAVWQLGNVALRRGRRRPSR